MIKIQLYPIWTYLWNLAGMPILNPLLDTFNLTHMLIRSQTFISIIFFMMAFQTRK